MSKTSKIKFFILIIELVLIISCIFYSTIKKNMISGRSLKLSDYVGTNIHELQWKTNFKIMSQYGVKVARDAFVWDIIERRKGKYDFVNNGVINYDDYIKKFKENKIRPYFILLYANKLYDKNNALDNKEIKHAYVKWVDVTSARYKNNHIIWEIYNEPNIEKFWSPQQNSATNYTDVVKRAATVIKHNDPTGLVVAPALAGTDKKALEWLNETFKLGILNYIDAVSIHPYRSSNPETVIEDYKKIRHLISKYTKKDIPIISGEWGYSDVPNWNHEGSTAVTTNGLEQAQYITRMILINKSQDIPISIIYDWKNDGTSDVDVEHHFGLMENNQITPKQSGIALKTLLKTIGNYKFIKRINLRNKNDYLLEFKNKKSQIAYAFWTIENNHTFTLKGNIDGELINMLGTNSKVSGKNIELTITKSPYYLINN